MSADVQSVVFRETIAHPETEVAERREAPLAGRRIGWIRTEAERNVLVADVRSVDIQSEPRIDLPRISERELIGVRSGERGRSDFVRWRNLTACDLIGRQRLAGLNERAVRVLDPFGSGVLVNDPVIRLHSRCGEQNCGIRVWEIVV